MALFFASETASADRGQVIVFKVPKDISKFFSSDTVSCLANLSQLTQKERAELGAALQNAAKTVFGVKRPIGGILSKKYSNPEKWVEIIEAFNSEPLVKRLVQFVREEKPYFQNQIDPVDLARISSS